MHKSSEKFNDICEIKHQLLHYILGQTSGEGMPRSIEEVQILGEYVDMIKDLAETEKACQEACYYESVVQAMDESGMMPERMGYNPNRNRMGQYSDGRAGRRPGDSRDSYSDNDGGNSNRSSGNNRSGYMPGRRFIPDEMMRDDDWYDDDDMEYGRSFDRFRKAKRHYTRTHSEEDKQKMKEASNKHMMETMGTIREMWDDADPDLRKRMKADLTNLMATMNA